MEAALNHQSAKQGDLIEISRGIYSHWAVYIGGDEVVHLVPIGGNDNLSVHLNSSQAIVKREKISVVVGSDIYKIDNQFDDKYNPRSGPDIMKKALEMVGQELPYSVIDGNSEHFATWLRYGEGGSQQVKNAAVNGMNAATLWIQALGAKYYVLLGMKRRNHRHCPQ